MRNPKVSVVIPVYNAENFVGQSIESILSQTYRDFELIIIDDGSTDNSVEVIKSYKDARIRFYQNKTNTGLAGVRNKGIQLSNGEYLAWLDADDISHPDRLARQVQILDSDEEIGICGTWTKNIGVNRGKVNRYPVENEYLKCCMIFYDPFATSSVMLRRKVLIDNSISFDNTFLTAEDYALWQNVSKFAGCCNIPQVLTYYRIHSDQVSSHRKHLEKQNVWRIQQVQINELDVTPAEDEKKIHLMLSFSDIERNESFLDEAHKWLLRLLESNNKYHLFNKQTFGKVLADKWINACMSSARVGLLKYQLLKKSPLRQYYSLGMDNLSRYFFKYGLSFLKV